MEQAVEAVFLWSIRHNNLSVTSFPAPQTVSLGLPPGRGTELNLWKIEDAFPGVT
jgi:hypothetical protein